METTDYTNRCGHCHKYMNPNDNYCTYCGTEKGKGEFRPFDNHADTDFGVSIKHKYRCNSCNNLWILDGYLGDAKYCPRCGKSNPELVEQKPLDAFYQLIGHNDPYDPDCPEELLTQNQISNLLLLRKDKYDFWTNRLLKAMQIAGIEISDQIYDDEGYRLTEKEAEQMILAERILQMQGTHVNTSHCCDKCGSYNSAVISYRIYSENDEMRNGTLFQAKVSVRDPLIHSGVYVMKQHNKGKREVPAYLCLHCGHEFGTIAPDI